jgi:pullulanase
MRKFLAGLLVLLTAVLTASPSAVALPESTELTIHYHRFDADYKDWNLWLWPKGGNGAAYSFTEDDSFGKVAKVKVPGTGSVEEIGIIVRLGEWLSKDVAEDRFIKTFKDGKAEIWIVQSDATLYQSKPSITTKLVTATARTFKTIEVSLNRAASVAEISSSLSVTSGSKPLAVASIASIPTGATSSNRVLVTLASDFALDGPLAVSHPVYGSATAELGDLYASAEFEKAFHYPGTDLGFTYTSAATSFRVWAPTASAADLLVYANDSEKVAGQTIPMTKSVNGTWVVTLPGDQHLTIYNFQVKLGDRLVEAVDPYAKAATINGTKGVVFDTAKTNPAGWLNHTKPAFSGSATDAVFYELHIRDLSVDTSSSVAQKGKFLGLTEAGTKASDGKTKTGVDAIVDLGITHLQLLPIYDYKTVDESRNDQFNWGYDPLNFNVPEGSYSTKPADPLNRITELKQTIQYLHSRGIRVVMDVVYNHVFDAGSHSFEKLVPGYFFRKEADGTFANGTGVGNEVASDRSMARKFIVESSLYWASEYKLDGFRYDLMGIIDVDTMNQVRVGVDKIDNTFLIIGEGWQMGNKLAPGQKANQVNAFKMPRIAHFNDGIRDGLKGDVFKPLENGWASGRNSLKVQVMEGITGETASGTKIRGSWGPLNPDQSVSYVEAHDNLTLFDKLVVSMPKSTSAERKRVFALASSTAILAQGVPFIHAGQEFMRTKGGDENSYKSPDSVNSLKWDEAAKNKDMVSYFKGLIAIRKANPAFRMSKATDVIKGMKFSSTPEDLIAYSLDASKQTNGAKRVFVIHNAAKVAKVVKLPVSGAWKVLAEGLVAKATGIRTTKAIGSITVPAQSTMVLSIGK